MVENINDIASVQETEVVSGEDYIILNIAKEIRQMRLVDLCAFIGSLIPIANRVFPQALTLNDIIKEMANKINTIDAKEVAYSGDLHKEYGNVNAVLMYLLDMIDKYESGGMKSDNVGWIPSENTPSRVLDELPNANISDVIDYILNKYRYSEDTINQNEIEANTSTWDKDDSIGVYNLYTQIEKLYELATKESVYESIFSSNPAKIEMPKSDAEVYTILDMNLYKQLNGIVEIGFCISIDCNIPGTFYLGLFKNDNVVQEFNIALAVGSNVITPFTFTRMYDYQDTPCNFKVKIAYKKDTTNGSIAPAIIPANGFTIKYSGSKLFTKEG